MKPVIRQSLILVTVMIFLSMITLFMLEAGERGAADVEPEIEAVEADVNETESSYQDAADMGLINQSIHGLRALSNDVQTGMEIFMPESEEVNESED